LKLNFKEVTEMEKNLLTTLLSLILLTCFSGAEGQYGYGMMGGYGMEPGMMGGGGYVIVPDKLPTPNSAEWIQNLSEVLSLEKRSYAQYTADEQKYNDYMPYMMIIPQEVDHISWIEKLFSAYGLAPNEKPEYPIETTNLQGAYQLAIQMEQDLISRYSWLTQNAPDQNSAQVLNTISYQSSWHRAMFQIALGIGGYGMGSGMMYGYGPGYNINATGTPTGYGLGYGMGPGMMDGYGMNGYGTGGMMGRY
jgi:hypothetical protein